MQDPKIARSLAQRRTDARAVCAEARRLWSHRNGRRPRVSPDGAVSILIDGNRSQVVHGRDVSGGRIFVGWDADLLRELSR